MMKKFPGLLLIMGLVSLSIQAEPAPPTMDRALPWWSNSSYVVVDSSNKFLVHTEVEYSYEARSGNIEGSEHGGKLLVAIRKSHLTNYFMLRSDYYDLKIVPNNQEATQEQFKIDNILRFDLNTLFFVDAGFYIEKDSKMLLDRRTAVYSGIGIYSSLPFHADLNFTIGMGNDTKAYSALVPLDDETNVNLYYALTFNYSITPHIAFSTKMRLQHVLEDAQDYEFLSESNLMVPVNKYVSLVYVLDWTITNQPWPGVLRADTHQAAGIQIHF